MQFNTNPNGRFIEIDKLILEFMWKRKCTRTTKKCKEKETKNNGEGPEFLVIKICQVYVN